MSSWAAVGFEREEASDWAVNCNLPIPLSFIWSALGVGHEQNDDYPELQSWPTERPWACALHRQEAEHAFLNAAHRFMANRWFRFERELGCRRMTCRYRWMASIVFINRAPERGTIFHL